MTDPDRPDHVSGQVASAQKWAPWWIYLIVLLGANYARNYFLPGSSLPPPLIAAIGIGQAALLFVTITAIWRFSRRGQS